MAATPTPRDWLERPEGLLGSVLGNRYRVTAILGRGPMGIACEGESSRGRQVTLKLLPRPPQLPVEHFAWQVRQALALAHFDHPNVSPISDFGPLEDGSAFVSRARTPGVTLRSVLRQGGLPLGRALEIARQIASALAAGHAQDIAHGRLKPENIIVHVGERPGVADSIKVVDFAMAALPVDVGAVALNDNDARRFALRTRVYLPYGVSGASPMMDVYSLGVLLFEMIAGQPPFVLDSSPPEGPPGPPLSFAQCNPALVVPGSVTELVAALLHPRAAEHGLSSGRAVQMLEALLGRPSLLAAEPVTSQMASAQQSPSQPPPAWNQPGPLGTVPPPDIRAFTTSSSPPLVWPSSPAPAPGGSSFPPLPQGFSPSMFPPPAVSEPSPSSFPPAIASAPPGATPFPPPAIAAHSVGSFPPPAIAAPPGATPFPPPAIAAPSAPPGGPYPPAPPSARNPARVDEPFATPSFPPPAGPMASSPDLDMELRPSFIGRLKRLFTRKRPGEF
jgi:serine/threonine-protein kinase